MADLTLYEDEDFSEDKLAQILRGEIKIFNADSHENNPGEVFNYSHTSFKHKHERTEFIFRCWAVITDFIHLNLLKKFSNLARIGL